jgi:hypothetical protein
MNCKRMRARDGKPELPIYSWISFDTEGTSKIESCNLSIWRMGFKNCSEKVDKSNDFLY